MTMTSSKKTVQYGLLPLISALTLGAFFFYGSAANAQEGCYGEGFRGGEGCYRPCERPPCEQPPCEGGPGPGPITPTPNVPPVITPTTPTFTPPTFVPPTTNVFPAHSPFIAPTDVTNPYMMNEGQFTQLPHDHALNGIEQLAFVQFPKGDDDASNDHPIYVFPPQNDESVQYSRLNPAVIDLKNGEVLISVRKPATLGLVHTPLGTIAIQANSEIILSYLNGVLRIINLDGLGRNVKIKFDDGHFENDAKVVSLKPGFELVVSAEVLTRKDIRPHDGLARRHFQVMEEGHLVISELSIASIIESSSLLADLKQTITGSQERRILGDMSKMASVLNYMNGIQGFSTNGPSTEHYGEKLSSKESDQTDE